MSNRNPTGNNQHSQKFKPPDDELAARLNELWLEAGMTWNKAAQRLVDHWHPHEYIVSGKTLSNSKTRLGVLGPRNESAKKDVQRWNELIDEQINWDTSKANGPLTVKQNILNQHGVRLPRGAVRERMHEIDDEGFDLRQARTKRIFRTPLTSAGPFDNVHGDGHEKLAAKCMFPIYGLKDRSSGYMLVLRTYPNVRRKVPMTLIYLQSIQDAGGMALHYTVDQGSETWDLKRVLGRIRLLAAPEIDLESVPVVTQLPSKRNTPIEGFWKWFHEKFERNIKTVLMSQLDVRCFLGRPRDRVIYFWVWAPIVEDWLERTQDWWNRHDTRFQKEKLLDSGMSPQHSLETAVRRGQVNCFVPVSSSIIEQVHDEYMAEQSEAADYYKQDLHFLTRDQKRGLRDLTRGIEMPPRSLETGWALYFQVKALAEDVWPEDDPIWQSGPHVDTEERED